MTWTKDFTLGGETRRHESKMFFRNFINLLIGSLILGVAIAGAWQWRSCGPLQRRYAATFAWTYWFTTHPGKPKTTKKELVLVKNYGLYWVPVAKEPSNESTPYRPVNADGGDGSQLTWGDGSPVIEWRVKMLDSDAYEHLEKYVYHESMRKVLVRFMLRASGIACLFIFGIALSWTRTGRQKMLDRFIRGTRALVPKRLNRLIRKAKLQGGLKVGEVWIPRGTESHHMLMIGGSGSGKTSAMFQLLYQLREIGAKVLICDTKLDFIPTFYNPQTDFIASPLDARSIYYNLHAEGSDVEAAEATASSLVQEDYGSANQFFVDAAQAVVAEAIKLGARQGMTSNAWFWKTVTSNLPELAAQFEGTEAGAHLDPTGERTAHSVRSTVLNHVRIFKYLPDPPSGRKVFSMRRWVTDPHEGFGFVCLRPRMRNIGRAFVSLLLEQAALALLDMPDQCPGEFPRLFLLIDELPILQRLANLVPNLGVLRSKGGAVIMAAQSFSQIRSIYGPDDATSLATLCGHHLVFRTKEPDTQAWCSRLLGAAECYQATEGLTLGGAHQVDRSSHNEQRREIPSVMASELKDIPDRYCWLSLSGSWPITLTEIPKLPRPELHPGFVETTPVDLRVIKPEDTGWNDKEGAEPV